ncbi:S8 family peptidase (plasmid) [Rhodococcus pyridinivorans]|uniref:S8 family peptidase n=1 Tax=Rhodococcus pyridinivorans TaxID=103816 RepID=UPI001C2FA33A|nr:S8 family peptidase [Rhodococcus pyridinivorans]QXF84288.1 S8 family peptidase [Rhodococcus pyridinivorans]
MAERDKPHLFISTARAAEYRPPSRDMDAPALAPPPDRAAHGTKLRGDLRQVEADARARRQNIDVTVEGALEGTYVVFESFPGIELALNTLDPRQGKVHPELRSVQEGMDSSGQPVERATVFVPDGTMKYFLDRVSAYLESADEKKPKNSPAIDRIQEIRAASIESLWTDPPQEFPAPQQSVWWEVWLRRRDGQEVMRLRAYAEATGMRVGRQTLGFGERSVTLLYGTVEQLATSVDILDDLAELRRPHDPTDFLAANDAVEQREWTDELLDRIEAADDKSPAVCVVDSGVYWEHPLLKTSLDAHECQVADPTWPRHDTWGHGTEMAGLALFGDVGQAIAGSETIRLTHRLESAKILPPPKPPMSDESDDESESDSNEPELFGAVTADALSYVEIQQPTRRRVYSLAVTARWQTTPPPGPRLPMFGQPSSWSATLDALAVGRRVAFEKGELTFLKQTDDPNPRLFCVSTGNVRKDSWQDDHLTRSDIEPVEDPAQAWNVLTIGAYTQLDTMSGAPNEFDGWSPVASRGQLSPVSRTSVAFGKQWPIKPDVVLEGGNIARSPEGTEFDAPPNLQLLTTKAPTIPGMPSRPFTTTHATSAATAQAAALAAQITAQYPSMWPETIRALIVHSAEWTPAMNAQFAKDNKKGARVALLRRYGMGVPDLKRATHSATDALTLISEGTIRPFLSGKMREIHYHELPWPTDILADLGDAPVKLRVTLSYFIEPNPGRRGWNRRYSYASHGLRFDIRRATESTADFQKRINQKALAEDETRPASAEDTGEWFFGSRQQQAPGSLHSDIWTGSAADLAQRGVLAVYPVTGWWKENAGKDRSSDGARYSLIVSIETPGQDVDIWTPVAQAIGVPVEIEI